MILLLAWGIAGGWALGEAIRAWMHASPVGFAWFTVAAFMMSVLLVARRRSAVSRSPLELAPQPDLPKVDWTLLNPEDREWAEQQLRFAGTEIDGKVELSNGEHVLICQRCRYPLVDDICCCAPSRTSRAVRTCRYCHEELVGVDSGYTYHVRCAVNSTDKR